MKIPYPSIHKGQKCWLCKKEIKEGWAYSGLHWWHLKCKEEDTRKRIEKYINNYNINHNYEKI